MRRKLFRNAALLRRHPASEDSNQAIAKCVLQNMYERISERLTDEEGEAYVRKENRERLERRVVHWKQNPVSEIYKEDGCTIRRGFSGEELFINYRDLRRMGTLRIFYQEVRTKLQVLPEHSLQLRFIGCRVLNRHWREHVVVCDDSVCYRYLRGSIIQAIIY